MKILLLGEYSNVHATLAAGLRHLGHEVLLVSNGDFWKDYPRDIDLSRRSTHASGMAYMLKLLTLLPKFRGYDVVQLINPMFLELKAERILPVYRYLRRHNRKVVLGAFGMDHYWADICSRLMPLRYSDFNIGHTLRHDREAEAYRREWTGGTAKERLNRTIAADCDGIVAGLYEYWVCYAATPLAAKTTYIPFPIVCNDADRRLGDLPTEHHGPLRMFIGINAERSVYKGTDIMLRAAEDIVKRYPGRAVLNKAVSVPFEEYRKLMASSDIILDQLYSYTPSMNPLEAMRQGIVCVGGGEADFYHFIGEDSCRPIINVEPSYESVFAQLEQLVHHPERLPMLKRQSIEFVRKHHDYIKVARQYVAYWSSLGTARPTGNAEKTTDNTVNKQ